MKRELSGRNAILAISRAWSCAKPHISPLLECGEDSGGPLHNNSGALRAKLFEYPDELDGCRSDLKIPAPPEPILGGGCDRWID
ncbi:MAG: hypothetical protein QNJ46_19425 [Leptolyngbyaceae cyanobacterium MO_188.B28]|nr:hypothetical protein [Leptolyngbyaceae cyanobacterium MO_188.B28]